MLLPELTLLLRSRMAEAREFKPLKELGEISLGDRRGDDTVGVDLREWVDEAEYKGWSKKGVRIPYKELPNALGFLREMKALVAKE